MWEFKFCSLDSAYYDSLASHDNQVCHDNRVWWCLCVVDTMGFGGSGNWKFWELGDCIHYLPLAWNIKRYYHLFFK